MKKILYMAVVALILTSCGTMTRNKAYSPEVDRFYMSDLVYLGESEVEIVYSTYLGFIKKIHTVNGVKYDSSNRKSTHLGLGIKAWGLSKATHKVLEEYPEGRYFKLVKRQKYSERLFLGNEIKEKATVRVYKYKN